MKKKNKLLLSKFYPEEYLKITDIVETADSFLAVMSHISRELLCKNHLTQFERAYVKDF